MSSKINKLILAPMEGVMDPLMRNILTQINSFDLCITEFIRVVDSLVPKHIFYKINPELHNDGYTESKTPIRVQLLGQNAEWMAENAIRALALGSHGIDLNFGCPAKAVNKSKGGAILLKTPDEMYNIISTVKTAIGADNTLSVKIRLGFDDATLLNEIVDAIVSAKANLLTIHARTKKDGYRPPAYWHYINDISKSHDIELIANGEVWSKTDAINCMEQSNTNNLMLGRGILALPNLANTIKLNDAPLPWVELCYLLQRYSHLELNSDKHFYYSSRMKQWLRYLRLQYAQADVLFEKIKRLKDKDEILDIVQSLQNSKSIIY